MKTRILLLLRQAIKFTITKKKNCKLPKMLTSYKLLCI